MTEIEPRRRMTYPRAFIIDCLECGCDIGDEISRNSREITLLQTKEQLDELRSRADHYANDGLDDAPHWLVQSARAVWLRTLEHRT